MREEYDSTEGGRGAVAASSCTTRVTIILDDDVMDIVLRQADPSGIAVEAVAHEALRIAVVGTAPPIERRARFIAEALAAEAETMASRTDFDAEEVHDYLLAKVSSDNPALPQPKPLCK